MTPRYLGVLNAGSSSIKFAVRGAAPELALIFRGQVEAIGVAPRLELKDADGAQLHEQKWQAAGFDHAAATRAIIAAVQTQLGTGAIAAVGHRVVHGGTRHAAPERVDAALLADLETLVPLAPLHQPHNLAPIRALAHAVRDLPQVVCFDTSFHASQPLIARSYALPHALRGEGVLRYGFHGISYEFVCRRLRDLAPKLAAGRVVIAHLGNGASLCAAHNGRSVATTMGFTAVEGLMMGTRCGSVDPGVLVYLMDQHQMGPREIDDLIYRRSGLLGVSGISSDMRTLRRSAEPAAAEAIALFVYRVVREIGSMAAALGGLDGLVFTAGIGEHDTATRDEIVAGCAWLGLKLDPALNAAGKCGRISSDQSPNEVWVIPTDEERMIAEHTAALLKLATG
jgi:acetate kinase